MSKSSKKAVMPVTSKDGVIKLSPELKQVIVNYVADNIPHLIDGVFDIFKSNAREETDRFKVSCDTILEMDKSIIAVLELIPEEQRTGLILQIMDRKFDALDRAMTKPSLIDRVFGKILR
jgi:hypothetical protein